MSKIFQLSVNADPSKLFGWIRGCRSGVNYNSRVNVLDHGDRWISMLDNDVYYVAYYHPTKTHSATIQGGILPWDKTNACSTANPGE
jgi:hypothetical protein